VLGKQLHRLPIGDRIGLRQVLHGLDQQALTVYVPLIGLALTSSPSNFGSNRNRENLSHENRTLELKMLFFKITG